MRDPFSGWRYVIHFNDGGAGLRWFDEQLQDGSVIREAGRVYTIRVVRQPARLGALGQAEATLDE